MLSVGGSSDIYAQFGLKGRVGGVEAGAGLQFPCAGYLRFLLYDAEYIAL